MGHNGPLMMSLLASLKTSAFPSEADADSTTHGIHLRPWPDSNPHWCTEHWGFFLLIFPGSAFPKKLVFPWSTL